MSRISHIIEDFEYENVMVFEAPDYAEAFLGVSEDNRAVYDYDKMIECLVEEDGMTEEEAADFISYNTIRALGYMGSTAPIILYRLVFEE